MQQARHIKHQFAVSIQHELFLLLVLHISQEEYIVPALARLEFHLDIMRSYRTPAMGNAVARNAFHDILRVTELVVQAYECLPVGVESVHRSVHAIERIVVAALLVFGLVIYYGAVHLDFSRREVALEILHVCSGIPETPLGE